MLPRPLMVALQEGAQPATPSQSPLGGWTSMLPLLLIFAIFYFVMIRPEGKKRKEREAMLQRIKKGDRVMTTGGMYASVAAVQDDVITLQVADGVGGFTAGSGAAGGLKRDAFVPGRQRLGFGAPAGG